MAALSNFCVMHAIDSIVSCLEESFQYEQCVDGFSFCICLCAHHIGSLFVLPKSYFKIN